MRCPFCFSRDVRAVNCAQSAPSGMPTCVECQTCEARGPSAEGPNMAVTLWNCRSGTTSAKGPVS